MLGNIYSYNLYFMALTFSDLAPRSVYDFSIEIPCPDALHYVHGGYDEWSSIVYCLAGQTMVGLSVMSMCDNAWKRIENVVMKYPPPVREMIHTALYNGIMACATKIE